MSFLQRAGSQDNIENLQLLCAQCNRVKGDRPSGVSWWPGCVIWGSQRKKGRSRYPDWPSTKVLRQDVRSLTDMGGQSTDLLISGAGLIRLQRSAPKRIGHW